MKRICMVCLPRTGSTFIGEILTTIYGLTNLIEPFTSVQRYVAGYQNGEFTILTDTPDYYESLDDNERVAKFLEILRTGNNKQPLVVKLFIIDSIMPYMGQILTTLRSTGFEFIIIRRKNMEQHLLSMGIAKQTNIWRKDAATIMKLYKVNVDINDMLWLDDNRRSFDERVKQYDITGPDIWYESARQDLARYTGVNTSFNVESIKIGLADPYKQISNADEVRAVIMRLGNKQ